MMRQFFRVELAGSPIAWRISHSSCRFAPFYLLVQLPPPVRLNDQFTHEWTATDKNANILRFEFNGPVALSEGLQAKAATISSARKRVRVNAFADSFELRAPAAGGDCVVGGGKKGKH
jgi:hypothetical protein